MYKCSIKRQRTTLVLIFSKKTCVIINKCITFVASKNVVLQELCSYMCHRFTRYVRNYTMNVLRL